MASDAITSWQIDGVTVETVDDLYFWTPKPLQMVTVAMKLKDTYSLEGLAQLSKEQILSSVNIK